MRNFSISIEKQDRPDGEKGKSGWTMMRFDGARHEGKVAVAFLGRVTNSATQFQPPPLRHCLRGGAEAATDE